MSRRDTIIVAVLVNAGLLIVLFASALKSNSPGSELVATPAPTISQETSDLSFKKEAPLVVGDEVNQALNQFSQNTFAAAPTSPMQTEVKTDQQLATTPMPFSTDFADDLKMITQTAEPSASPSVQTLTVPISPQATTAPEFSEIKVKKGDVLEKIARHHHSTVAEVMKANKLTSTNLRIGQVLKIPNKSIKKAETSTISHSTPSTSGSAQGGPKYYTVKKGDSPWTIAVKNHIKVEDLLKLNNMSEEKARRLKPGDQLRIQ